MARAEKKQKKKFLERSHDMFYTPLHYHSHSYFCRIYRNCENVYIEIKFMLLIKVFSLKHPMEGKAWRETKTHIGHHLHFSNCQ